MSHNFEHYLSTGGHLDDIQNMYRGGSPGSPSPAPRSGSLHPPSSNSDGLDYVTDIFQDILPPSGGSLPSTGLASTPSSSWVLRLVIWAPLSLLPPPSQDPELHQTVTDAVSGVVDDCFRGHLEPFHDMSGDVQVGFQDMVRRFDDIDKKFNFLTRTLLSSPVPASNPSSPPSSTPVAAPAQDVEMAHPPAPAPVVAPVAPLPAPAPAAVTLVPAVPAPAPVSKPRAKKPRV
ncbi:hypothetical protein EDB89DRAFT_2138481 [Lactarius sanguifluus]|nr:hypothetical protein EDB89DRAFT_2138481 [Lactarius sanguifluus]